MVRQLSFGFLVPALLITHGSMAQSSSDGCSFAAGNQYPVNTSCVNVVMDIANGYATNLSPALCGGAAVQDDGFCWFTAIGTSTTVTYTATNAGHNPSIHIYAGTACGSLGAPTCYNTLLTNVETAALVPTTIGQSYLVRIQRNGSNSAMAGNICISSPLLNDSPCSATSLAVGASCASITQSNTGATNSAGPPAPGCGSFGGTSRDVWYTIVAPASGHVNVSTTAGTLTDAAMAVYSATTCAGPFTLVSCNDNANGTNMPAIDLTGLTPSTTYYVRVWGTGATSGTYAICAYDMPSDAPCTATALTVNASCSLSAATNVGASQSGIATPSCGTFNATSEDVWFRFTAPATGHVNVNTTAGTLTDAAMAVYSATACAGTFTQLACNDNANGTNMPAIDLVGLTPGTTYYVRIWGNGAAVGTFNICAYDMPGDAPCTSTSLTVNTTCSSTAGTNVGASQSGITAPSCGTFNSSSEDVWFRFVAPASGNTVLNVTAGTLTNTGMAVYSAASCSAAMTQIGCSSSGSGIPSLSLTGLTSGATYFIRIWGNGAAVGTFSICATEVLNNEPCGAITITPGTSCSPTTYTNSGSTVTGSIPVPGCATVGGGDVWFRFVAPASGFVTIRTQAGTLTNTAMALYSAATCSSAMVLLDCDDNSGVANASFLTFSDLVGGTTYYLRIWGVGGNFGTFDLCMYGPPTGSSCFYTLRLEDAIGDGWGGSTVGISINGGGYTNYTLTTGERDVIYFGVTTGQLIMMQYTSSGSGQGEISYVLQLDGGILYNGGPTPATGLVYTGVVDCVAPAASSSDCRGAGRLCGATSFNGSPSNTGLVSDLNVQNRGCLSSSERQGLWYYFIPAANGTFAFTIAPNNPTDDYDFAVWGPFTSFDCSQKGVPLRCSYSGLTGNTGLQVGAGDDTEGSGGDKWVNEINANLGEVYILYVSNFSRSGLAFGLNWSLTNGASLDCLVLPIELGGFQAQPSGEQVDLNWWTASEQNNDHFIVERSADAQHFLPIGTVAGAGNSTVALHYAWQDHDPLPGTSYYRLRQVDYDGQDSHSPIESVNFQRTTTTLTAFPNPAKDIVHFPVEALQQGSCEIRILDAQGRVVLSQQAALSEGAGRVDVPVDALPAGQYIAQVIGPVEQGIITGRFVITR